MIYQKPSSQKLTTIEKARIKRSASNNTLQIKPIQLKSLKDARNEAKSLNKNLLLNFSSLDDLLDNFKTMKKEEIPEEALKPEENKRREDIQENRKNNEREKTFQNREEKKDTKAKDFSKGKNSIIKVFDNLEQRNTKKLTKEEAKGLVNRLQGRTLFKFN